MAVLATPMAMASTRAARFATYVDTSVWCAYCFNDEDAEKAVQWLANVDMTKVGTAWWTRTEFESALALQLRKKALNESQANRSRKLFADLMAMVVELNVIREDFLEAAKSCSEHVSRLRAADALHLAIAGRHGCKAVATLDKDMRKNALRLGLEVIDL